MQHPVLIIIRYFRSTKQKQTHAFAGFAEQSH